MFGLTKMLDKKLLAWKQFDQQLSHKSKESEVQVEVGVTKTVGTISQCK